MVGQISPSLLNVLLGPSFHSSSKARIELKACVAFVDEIAYCIGSEENCNSIVLKTISGYSYNVSPQALAKVTWTDYLRIRFCACYQGVSIRIFCTSKLASFQVHITS
jgi:hypothetical protein